MLREVVLEEIEDCCPQLLSAFALWVARDSVVVMFALVGKVLEFKTGVGVDQVCPVSPVVFDF